jgi:hypothetical protein
MLSTKAALCCENGSTEGESKYNKVMMCLEDLNEIKWLTDSDICFGDDTIEL